MSKQRLSWTSWKALGTTWQFRILLASTKFIKVTQRLEVPLSQKKLENFQNTKNSTLFFVCYAWNILSNCLLLVYLSTFYLFTPRRFMFTQLFFPAHCKCQKCNDNNIKRKKTSKWRVVRNGIRWTLSTRNS